MTIVINGTTGISGVDGSAGTPAVQGTDTNTGVFYPAADTVGVSTGGSERMRVDSSGNVGIGTSSPANKLDIVGSSNILGLTNTSASGYEAINMTVGTQQARILLTGQSFGDANYGTGDLTIQAQTSGKGIRFGTSGNTNQMLIDSSGNVGIGTSSPSYRLDVSGAATATPVTNGIIRILTTGSNPPTGYGGGLVFSQVDSSAVNRDYASITGSRVNSSANNQVDMVFSTGDPGGGSIPITERMRLTTAGNLLVAKTTQISNERFGVGSGSNVTTAWFQQDTNTSGYNGIVVGLGSNGNNTSSSFLRGNTNTVGNWYLYGNGTQSFSSDQRLKKNIETTRDGYLEDLAKLRVVKYNWKNDPDGTPKELGLIAQEVAIVFPGLVQDDANPVSEDDPTVYKQVKHSVLPFILLKAIQEQQALITALTARIEALENK